MSSATSDRIIFPASMPLLYEKPQYVQGEHYYLSTGCFHGVHAHCQSGVNVEGEPKAPATCKFCPARGICPCHNPASHAALPAVIDE